MRKEYTFMLKLLKSRSRVRKQWKEMSFCQKLAFSNSPDGVNIRYFKLWSKSPSLKYEILTPLGFKDIGIRKFYFVSTT